MQDRFKFRAWDKLNKELYFVTELRWAKRGGSLEKWFTERYKLMQSTGIKDKNDNLIYESDILRRNKKRGYELRVVIWRSKKYCNSGWNIGLSHREGWEVIGNIYENPELIKL